MSNSIIERVGNLLISFPPRSVAWIDAYNCAISEQGSSGTITKSINNSIYFVAIPYEDD